VDVFRDLRVFEPPLAGALARALGPSHGNWTGGGRSIIKLSFHSLPEGPVCVCVCVGCVCGRVPGLAGLSRRWLAIARALGPSHGNWSDALGPRLLGRCPRATALYFIVIFQTYTRGIFLLLRNGRPTDHAAIGAIVLQLIVTSLCHLGADLALNLDVSMGTYYASSRESAASTGSTTWRKLGQRISFPETYFSCHQWRGLQNFNSA
jgi:hypothetical protein